MVKLSIQVNFTIQWNSDETSIKLFLHPSFLILWYASMIDFSCHTSLKRNKMEKTYFVICSLCQVFYLMHSGLLFYFLLSDGRLDYVRCHWSFEDIVRHHIATMAARFNMQTNFLMVGHDLLTLKQPNSVTR
jgi:hypothetical protein